MAFARCEIAARYRARHLEKELARGRACSKAHHATYRDEAIAAMKARYSARREEISAKRKAQRLLPNRDAELAGRREQWIQRREQQNAQRRLRRLLDGDAVRCKENARRDADYRARAVKRTAEWNRKHPEWARALARTQDANRRAREREAFVESVDPRVVFERDNGRCGICMQPVDANSKWHVDHIVPISKGGPHSYVNVQLAHARCNIAKGNRCA